MFLWREPKPAAGGFTVNFVRTSGHVHANGIPYAYWTFNSGVRSGSIALTSGAPPVPTVEIGTGLHRGYTEQWFDLVAGAKPVLRFDVGYPLPEDKRQRPLAFSVRITDNPLPEVKPDGASLPRPKQVLFEDTFADSALAPGWTVEMSPAHGEAARVAPEGGRLAFTGQHYKYQYVSRPWPAEADTVQALSEVRLTGCAPRWNPALGLWWGPGRWAFTSLHGGRFVAELAGSGSREFPLALTEQPVYQERFYGWLRMKLTADNVLFFFSTDGQTWTPKAEFPRGPKYSDPPQLLILGRGTGGPNDAFKNDERWATSVTTCYLDDLVVGKESP